MMKLLRELVLLQNIPIVTLWIAFNLKVISVNFHVDWISPWIKSGFLNLHFMIVDIEFSECLAH